MFRPSLILTFISFLIVSAAQKPNGLWTGVEIKTYKINSPNNFAAYRLDINNFRKVPIENEFTLYDLLPKDDTLAPRYNVTSVMERSFIGTWKLMDKFAVKLLPFGGVFYELVPISDIPVPDKDSDFDNENLETVVTSVPSPNSLEVWQITFKNTNDSRMVQRFKIRNLLPSSASLTTKYRVTNGNDCKDWIVNVDQYFYVEVDSGKERNFKFVSVIGDIEETDDYYNYNITAAIGSTTGTPKLGRLSIIFNGVGIRYHTFISPANEMFVPETKVWYTTMAPIKVDQIESIDFGWIQGKEYNQGSAVGFDKIVIEPIYLMDKKMRKDKTIAFLGSSFFLNEMYFNLKRKVDPFDDSIRP